MARRSVVQDGHARELNRSFEIRTEKSDWQKDGGVKFKVGVIWIAFRRF